MLEIIKVFGETFHNVLIITRNPSQPLMLEVESLVNRSVKTIHYNGKDTTIPEISPDANHQHLICFDDIMLVDDIRFTEYFTR